MSPWAKRILIASMLVWTLLTGAAGWYALSAGGSHAVTAAGPGSDARGVTGMPAAANAVPSPSAVATSIASHGTAAGNDGTPQAPGAVATPRPNGSLQPPPEFAQAGDASGRVQSLDADGSGRDAPRPASTARAVIVLDPGHGRGDPGAVHYLPDGSGRWDITEADSNLRNAELLRDDLVAMGYEVYLTRDGAGRGPDGPLPLQFITSDLYARVGLAKAVDANLYLAIHGNGATVHSISGPETWYCGHHDQSAANEELAGLVQQAMMDALHEYGYFPPDRGTKEDAASHHSGDFCQFVVTRETPVPAALLEFLFLTNDDDARVLVDDRSHVLMAQHVATAIDTFMRERGR